MQPASACCFSSARTGHRYRPPYRQQSTGSPQFPRQPLGWSGKSSSLEKNELVVAGVSGFLENECPLVGSVKRPARELPVEQIHLLALVPVGFDADVFRP